MRNLAEEIVFNHLSIHTFIHLGAPFASRLRVSASAELRLVPQVPAAAGLDRDVAVETTSAALCRLALVGAEQPRGRACHCLTPPGVYPDRLRE